LKSIANKKAAFTNQDRSNSVFLIKSYGGKRPWKRHEKTLLIQKRVWAGTQNFLLVNA
jgi:hypothetical protein